ncbi:MAG TPA: sulfur carrier protein ThiS [Geminicoccus sp.]|uniref:sulfur carrier protein ThiS n=1 Tax=Geminicoccus sp. TaxID=2024832 RepID=UPI002B9F85CC|nr:sulfur carrier protein ThiS [Geminicoccus sp.]HWL66867.1 sulfur carrier protein ThiS [Geminicoccus sp.]
MKIIVNGQPVETGARSLAALLEELGYGGIVVATAVNGDFTPAARRAETELKDGDQIEVLAPMQGG